MHGLFCSKLLVTTRSDGEASFYFSDPNTLYSDEEGHIEFYGSGHISFSNEEEVFTEAKLGFSTNNCRVTPIGGSCLATEVCVLKASSNTTNAHVASCTQEDRPNINSYRHKICCTPTEYCRDGIDNTGDGLVDCQSPECHATFAWEVPQRCDPGDYDPGNNQTTLECVTGGYPPNPEFSPHCTYTDAFEDKYYYCSYGEADDPSVGEGYCCPEGQYYDAEDGVCTDFTKCGIDSVSLWCDYDVNQNFGNWLSELFVGEPDDPTEVPKWCHSHLPLFRETASRSEACCPIIHAGTYDYFVVDENVKIFGYE